MQHAQYTISDLIKSQNNIDTFVIILDDILYKQSLNPKIIFEKIIVEHPKIIKILVRNNCTDFVSKLYSSNIIVHNYSKTIRANYFC